MTLFLFTSAYLESEICFRAGSINAVESEREYQPLTESFHSMNHFRDFDVILILGIIMGRR